jgi:hypothetical protein
MYDLRQGLFSISCQYIVDISSKYVNALAVFHDYRGVVIDDFVIQPISGA